MRAILLFLAVPLWADVMRTPSADGGATCSNHPCTLAVTCANSPCGVSEIQTAINEAWLGDTITLEAGKTWAVTTQSIVLYRRTNGSGVLTIRTSADDALLPASDTRITPAYAPLLAEIRLAQYGRDAVTVEQTGNSVQNYQFLGIWFSEAEGLDNDTYSLVTTWVPNSSPLVNPLVLNASNTSPITLTLGSTNGLKEGDHVVVNSIGGNTAANGWHTITNITPTTVDLVGTRGNGVFATTSENSRITKVAQYDVSQTPDNITFDRCLILPKPLSATKTGLRLAGRHLTVKNSYCDEVKAQTDSQCVSMPSTPGPVTITNNFLGGGSGETVMTGGAVPNLAGAYGDGQDATDITVTHNVFYKDPALYKYEAWAANTWVRKGKVIVENGVKYIALTSGTTGEAPPAFPLLACSSPAVCSGGCCATDGSVTWAKVWFTRSSKWTHKNLFEIKRGINVALKWNSFDGNWTDAQTTGPLLVNCTKQAFYTGMARCQNIEIAYNTVKNALSFLTATSRASPYGDELLTDLNIHDNLVWRLSGAGAGPTIATAARSMVPPYFSGLRIVHNTIERNPEKTQFWSLSTGGHSYEAPVVTDNLFDISGAAYPIICSACPSTSLRKAALDNMATGGYTFTNNVLAGENLLSWPSGNFDTAWGRVGFGRRDAGDFRLSNASPYRSSGSDGRDVGADMTQLPMLNDFRLAVNDRAALFTWDVTEPIKDIPCVIEVSPERDFSTVIDDLDPTRFPRPETSNHDRLPQGEFARSLVVGANSALSNGTTYWYRLHCGGAFRQGSFTTLNHLEGSVPVSVTKRRREAHSGFEVEWGLSYSRAADRIGDGGTVQAVCDVRDICAATFEPPTGSALVYYRIREKDESGNATPRPVHLQVVQGQEASAGQ